MASDTTTSAAQAADAATSSGSSLYHALMDGGWWSGDVSTMLWIALAALVLACVSGMGWVTGLPQRKRGHRPKVTAPPLTRILFSLALCGIMMFVLNHGGIPIWNALKSHVWPILGAFVPFLAIGFLWARYQYGNFASDNKEEIQSIGVDYCNAVKLDPKSVMKDVATGVEFNFPDESHKVKWPSYFESQASACVTLAGATANEPKTLFLNNKEQITLWVLFWPTSLVFRFWTDIIGRGWDRLLMASRGFFERATAKHDVRVTYGPPPTAPAAAGADSDGKVVNLKSGAND